MVRESIAKAGAVAPRTFGKGAKPRAGVAEPPRAKPEPGKPSRPSLRERLLALRNDIETHLYNADFAPDLAEDIGSRRWFRGLGTMLGLGLVAISFWPDFTAVEAATAMPVDSSVREEFRSQMIMPLALGADSGRRMGATPAVLALKSAPERPTLQMVATLGQGDSFLRMLQRAGVGLEDADRVATLVNHATGGGSIAPGTQFDIVLGKRPEAGAARPLERLDFRARFDLELAVERKGGVLGIDRRPVRVDETPLRIRGMVGNSLYRSARAAGAPLKAIQQYLRAIDQHVSLESDVQANDQFDFILSYKRSARGERQVGELLFAGIERSGKPRLQLLRWGKDGQFYEASGVGRTHSRYVRPVAGRITSNFGMRRHPILGYARMHSGVDFAGGYGTPIQTVSDGVVVYAGRHGGHGKYVRVNHGNGLGSGYAHMSQIAVAPGSHVRAGQVIGYVGSTGLSTGPHLHFEVYRGDRKVDPLSVQFIARPQIDGKELAAFKARLAALKAIAPGSALGDIKSARSAQTAPEREIDKIAARRDAAAPASGVDPQVGEYRLSTLRN